MKIKPIKKELTMKIMKIKKIKRLIKKAEFVDGIKTDSTNSGMLSIYKNPTSKEIEEAKSESNSESIVQINIKFIKIY